MGDGAYRRQERCGENVDALPGCNHNGTTHVCVREAGHEMGGPGLGRPWRHQCGCGATWRPTDTVDELIERSSLGTPGAKALRERTPPEVVDRIMRKVEDPVIQMKRAVVALGAEVPEDVWTDLRQRWNAVAGHVKELRAERSDLVDAATNLLAMKDRLLLSGSPTNEAFLRDYDEAKRRWAHVIGKTSRKDTPPAREAQR